MNFQEMFESIKHFNWTIKSVFRLAVIVIVAIVALAIVLSVLGKILQGAAGFVGINTHGGNYGRESSFVDDFRGAFDGVAEEMGFAGGMGVASKMMAADAMIAPEPPFLGGGGEDAEEYERRNYNAHYETRAFERVCGAVEALKPLEHVVFDYSNKSEDWCNYTFRVEVDHEEEVIATLKDLNPRDFSVNIDTLEESIEYHDNELALVQRRLESITSTLTEAETAYDGLIRRATNQGDVENLSTIINNKINTLERLTQQQLNYQERVDRLTKGKGDVEEQVEYAHFSVSVQKTTIVDLRGIGDAWKENVSDLFWKINDTLLALTLGLIAFVFAAVQFVVYAVVVVLGLTVLARFLWVGVRKIWKWKKETPVQDHQSDY